MAPSHYDPHSSMVQQSSKEASPHRSLSISAIVALVLGILALLTSFVPIINNGSFVLGVIALVLAIIGTIGTVRGKRSGKSIAIAALVVAVLSCAVVLATQSMYSAAIDESLNPSTETVDSESTLDSADAAAANSDSSGQVDFTVADEELVHEQFGTYITGTITNNKDTDLSYVGVSYTLYDSNGAVIGNAYANASDVKAGQSWKFEAYCTADSDDIASFERGGIDAW